jgi:ubiquinone biosynthesis monooxygenase Coq7
MFEPLIIAADNALRTLSGVAASSRPTPKPAASFAGDAQAQSNGAADDALSAAEKSLSGSLMRVNHVGEVCAQALYLGQSMATQDGELSQKLLAAARDETDHLAWTQVRLKELGARPSLLNPVWYAGAFALGWLAGRIGDTTSLGFVVETERQVEQHLDEHLERLPASDRRSRAIVQQMKSDEARHAEQARQAGAIELPAPVRWGMRAAAMVMTRTAHHL